MTVEPAHLTKQQSTITGHGAPQVAFVPQPDITAFEVAELLRLFTILVANGNPSKTLTVASDHVRTLPPETRRHFNEQAVYGGGKHTFSRKEE
jgi:hypothetical protein